VIWESQGGTHVTISQPLSVLDSSWLLVWRQAARPRLALSMHKSCYFQGPQPSLESFCSHKARYTEWDTRKISKFSLILESFPLGPALPCLIAMKAKTKCFCRNQGNTAYQKGDLINSSICKHMSSRMWWGTGNTILLRESRCPWYLRTQIYFLKKFENSNLFL
jgi:hypothetical protein